MSTLYSPYGHRPVPRGQARREAVAWHEAGHAVAAVALGMQGVYIDLDPDPAGDDSAVTHYRVPDKWGASNARRRELAVTYAGMTAEIRHYGCAQIPGSSGADGRQAKELLEAVPVERRSAVSGSAYQLANEALGKHWSDLEWIARTAQGVPMLSLERVDADMIAVVLLRCEPSPAERAQARAA